MDRTLEGDAFTPQDEARIRASFANVLAEPFSNMSVPTTRSRAFPPRRSLVPPQDKVPLAQQPQINRLRPANGAASTQTLTDSSSGSGSTRSNARSVVGNSGSITNVVTGTAVPVFRGRGSNAAQVQGSQDSLVPAFAPAPAYAGNPASASPSLPYGQQPTLPAAPTRPSYNQHALATALHSNRTRSQMPMSTSLSPTMPMQRGYSMNYTRKAGLASNTSQTIRETTHALSGATASHSMSDTTNMSALAVTSAAQGSAPVAATDTAGDENVTSSENSTQFPGNLFCWALMMPHGNEVSLMKMLLDRGAGIFGCNAYDVFSSG
eukprot:CAMPEP_0172879038 /NCGR_PEP_ID=MMETSP1075-20121228/111305_1 /TAXON_ID=2916 /ORGANISM="Ceratium fusus, Strain PA161109" /LENGTH=321 /DNA_ID=CAMNT_0013730961 /DNA_START=208 /DNA_END=1170 /DNA_ORIENTATION=+